MPNCQLQLITVLVDGLAFHVFHDKKRLTAGRGAAVVELGNVGVFQARQDVALLVETLQYVCCIHALFEQFERHLHGGAVVAVG